MSSMSSKSSKSSNSSKQRNESIIPSLLNELKDSYMDVSCKEFDSSRTRLQRGGTKKELIKLSDLSLLVFFLHGRYDDIDNSVNEVKHIAAVPPGCTPLNLQSLGIRNALMIGAAPPGIINIGNCEELPLFSKLIKEYTEELINTLLTEHLKKSLNDVEEIIAQKISTSGVDSPPQSPKVRERSRSPERTHIENPNKNSKHGERERERERKRELSRGEHTGMMEKIRGACKFCLNFVYRIVFSPSSLLGYAKQSTPSATPFDSGRASSSSNTGVTTMFTACSENKPDKTCELSGDFFVEVASKLRDKLKEMDTRERFPYIVKNINPQYLNSKCFLAAKDTSGQRFGPVKIMRGFGSDIDPHCFNKTLYFHPVNDGFSNFGAKIFTISKKQGKISFKENIIRINSIFPTNAAGIPIGWNRDADGGQWTTMQNLLHVCRNLGLTEHIMIFDGTCSVFKTDQSCAATFERGIVLGGGDKNRKIKIKINISRGKKYKKIRTNRANRSKQISRLKHRNNTKKKYIPRKKIMSRNRI